MELASLGIGARASHRDDDLLPDKNPEFSSNKSNSSFGNFQIEGDRSDWDFEWFPPSDALVHYHSCYTIDKSY
jgi:hypothetical protein